MSEVNRAKVTQAQQAKRLIVGGVYRRTRRDQSGRSMQRAEVRFDGVSGCLRTPAGGSSRQTILVVNGQSVKARLITIRETARLMGLPEEYKLPENYSGAYHLTGDGVVVPVVRHLAQHIFEPLLREKTPQPHTEIQATPEFRAPTFPSNPKSPPPYAAGPHGQQP
jgi:DNA (cytosine-5)-methyltransferase 1